MSRFSLLHVCFRALCTESGFETGLGLVIDKVPEDPSEEGTKRRKARGVTYDVGNFFASSRLETHSSSVGCHQNGDHIGFSAGFETEDYTSPFPRSVKDLL